MSEPRRVDVVQVSLYGGPVSLPWDSRQALLAEFRDDPSRRSLLAAFENPGTSRPVELTPEQKNELADAIDWWANRVGHFTLPEGVLELRDGLAADSRSWPGSSTD